MDIRVPTTSLRALLDDTPEIRLKLESFACEKIAEEIARKAPSRVDEAVRALETRLHGASVAIETRAEKAIKQHLRDIGSRYNMPREVRDQIDTAVKEGVTRELEREVVKVRNHLQRDVAQLFEDAGRKADAQHKSRLAEFEAAASNLRELFDRELKALVEKQARQSFVDVLRDVQNGTLGIF